MTVSDSPYAQGLAYVDGEVCPLADARLPLVEAGFTRSDVTYDVVAVWNGKFFRLDEHL
jgi:branched-subunit amino acid aminotransferase/4-amino-4-deoxychorismate lyase